MQKGSYMASMPLTHRNYILSAILYSTKSSTYYWNQIYFYLKKIKKEQKKKIMYYVNSYGDVQNLVIS